MGSRSPVNCPPGTYSDTPGAKSKFDCKACDAGKYCLGAGKPQPDGDCLPGYYCPLQSKSMYEYTTLPGYYSKAAADRQTPCETGKYNPLTAQSSCQDCPAGFYCPNTATSDLLLDCPKGAFCP